MFDKLFKNTGTPLQGEDMRLVAEIHNAIDTAQDRLLSEAQALLSKCNVSEQDKGMADRLRALGFNKTQKVRSVDETEENERKSKENAELIIHYKKEYPFLKFLTEDELDRICEKYNLIHAPVSSYIKDVPEKNLEDIEKAQPIKEGDEWNWEEATRIKRLKAKEKYRSMSDSRIDDLISAYLIYDPFRNQEKEGLFIAAPKSHFDLSDLRQQEGDKYAYRPEPKDPIVFRYVRGGIQVLTKWGLEASDPALLNPVDN